MDAFKLDGMPVMKSAVSENELVPLKLITKRNRALVQAAMVKIGETDGFRWDEQFRTTKDGCIGVAVILKGETAATGMELWARNVAPVEYFLVRADRKDYTGAGCDTHGTVSAMTYGVRHGKPCRVELAAKK